MSEPKLIIKEESSAKKTRSPPKKPKVEQSVPRKKKLKTDADKAAERAQHLRFGKAEITPDEASRMTKQQKRAMYAAAAARSAVHREVDQYEDDNVGTQALSEGEKAAGNVRDISKSIYKFCALMLSVALCAGMAAPAFAYGGEPVEEVEQPVLTSTTDEEDVVTVTDEETGALTPEGNLTMVDDYHTSYSDGSGQQFITLVSKSGNTFYLVIDRNDKGENTVHFMNLVDEADLLSLMEDEDADAYTAEKEAAAQAEQERKQAEEDAKKAAEEAAASGSEQTGGNKVTKYL